MHSVCKYLDDFGRVTCIVNACKIGKVHFLQLQVWYHNCEVDSSFFFFLFFFVVMENKSKLHRSSYDFGIASNAKLNEWNEFEI